MNHYKALIVDFGGVLTTPLQDAMVEFAGELGIELQDLARAALGAYAGLEDDLVVGFETGKISEDEFAERFAERLTHACGRPVEAQGIITRMFGKLQLEESMLQAVALVHQSGVKTALLSNSWGTSLYPKERLHDIFDVIIISGEVGLRKPDPEIFRLTTKELGVSPEECLFVDDHPGHLKAAAEEGIATLLHRSPETSLLELEKLLGASLR